MAYTSGFGQGLRGLAVSFSLAAFVALTGCGGGADGLESSSSKTLATVPAGSGEVFTVAPMGSTDNVQSAQARSFINAAVQNTTGSSAVTAADLFAWAERSYPTLFPAGPSTQTFSGYDFRFYPSTDWYLGVSNNRVYVLNASQTQGQVVDVGALTDFVKPLSLSDILVDRVSFGRQSVFRLNGENLDAEDFNLSITQGSCLGLSVIANSPTAIFVACLVQSTGPLTLKATSSSGTTLLEKSFVVPSPRVAVSTNLGSMVVELLPEAAPVSVLNFLQYVNSGFYNGTIFHRLEPGFVIQGGAYLPDLTAKTGLAAPIALESNKGLRNLKGTIAMARTEEADSATSQFYFNLADNPGLNYQSASSPGYAVFGRVVEGSFVLDLFPAVSTGPEGGLANVPTIDIIMRTVAQIQ
jgi:cyclophilin family peptidyl-prolyl cis-trans isomerase